MLKSCHFFKNQQNHINDKYGLSSDYPVEHELGVPTVYPEHITLKILKSMEIQWVKFEEKN